MITRKPPSHSQVLLVPKALSLSLLGLILIQSCNSDTSDVVSIGPTSTNSIEATTLTVSTPILSEVVAGSLQIQIQSTDNLPESFQLQDVKFVALPTQEENSKIYSAILEEALTILTPFDTLSLPNVRQATISIKATGGTATEDQTQLIFYSDPTDVTFDDFVTVFALSQLPVNQRLPQTIVDLANQLFPIRPQPYTVADLDPIPNADNTDFINNNDQPAPDLADVAAVYAASLVTPDLRTPSFLAESINELVPSLNIQPQEIQIVPGEIIITPESTCSSIGTADVDYLEHEIWSEGGKLTFMDYERKVWVADLDPTTGRMIPDGGQGFFAGQGARAYPNSSLPYGQNNPVEFLISARGAAVVYEGQDIFGVPQIFRTTLTDANPTPQQVTFGPEHTMNITSRDTAFDAGYYIYLRDYLNPFTRQSVAQFEGGIPFQISILGPKYIPGEKAVSYPRTVNFRKTISKFNLQTRVESIVVDNALDPFNTYLINADEFGGQQVAIAQILNRNQVVLYRQLPGNSQWSAARTFTIGVPTDFIYNRELFNYNGGTYFLTQVIGEDANSEGIWLTKLDGTINTKIASPTTEAALIDPEYFITQAGDLFVYTATDNSGFTAPALVPSDMIVCKVTIPNS